MKAPGNRRPAHAECRPSGQSSRRRGHFLKSWFGKHLFNVLHEARPGKFVKPVEKPAGGWVDYDDREVPYQLSGAFFAIIGERYRMNNGELTIIYFRELTNYVNTVNW